MNAEQRQQLFGGEISDHFIIQNKIAPEFVNAFFNNDKRLDDIYTSQVKPIGQVVVTNSPTNISMDVLIEREPDKAVIQLQNTLTKIANEYGLTSDSSTNVNFTPSLKDQSSIDIQQANDAVVKALEELKSLGEF